VRRRFLFVRSYCIAFQEKVNSDSSRQSSDRAGWLRQHLPQKAGVFPVGGGVFPGLGGFFCCGGDSAVGILTAAILAVK